MDIYYQPDIFLVSGMPSNGKTNFAIGYCKEKSNTSIIHIDEVFLLMRDLFPEEDDIQKNLDIYKYVNHSSFDKQQFLKLFVIELGKAFRCMNFYKSLIIEGYICDKLHDDMKKIISDMGYKNIYEVVANRTCDGYMITLNKTCMGITKNFYYGNIVNAIDNFLAERKNIKNKVTYQKFPWHDLTNINSNSDIKYEASLKNVSLFQKSFLDVGCNTGYFCFKAKAAGAKKVIGVDAGSNWIELAYDINKYFFNYNDIFFLNCSVFDVDFPHKFDVVFCI